MSTATYGVSLYGGVGSYGAALVTEAPAGGTLDSLELAVEVVKPDGRRYLWDAHGYAEDVPTGVGFSTKRQEGFSTFSCTLARRGDEDHPDIELRDELNVLSASGDVVWEGRVTAAPMSLDDDGWSIDVQATGHIAALKDRKFVDVFVDRDVAQWREPSLLERGARGTAGWEQDISYSVTSERGLVFHGKADGTSPVPNNAVTSKVYRMPTSRTVTAIQYKGTQVNTTSVEAATLYTDSDPDMSSASSTALTLNGALQTASPTTPEQYAELRAKATAGHVPGATVPFTRTYSQLAVYGTSLATYAISGEPNGVYASEAMEHILSNYCTGLTWAGNDTTYPIAHLAFRDLIYPYDALLEINRFHLLDLACWENKTVTWRPIDLSDWDWEVSQSDPGYKMTLEGDDDQGSGFNGIVIQYTDLATDEVKVLWPDEHDELRDDDELNPANRHGQPHWADETLTHKCLEADALQMGRALLAERNQPKAPGNHTISGYVRNRQGVWQPAWKVRAGDRIVVVDHPNRRPRLITETSFSADSKTLTLSTDMEIRRIEAFVDRLDMALQANGLS